ncbi:hypothetical protein GBAR_LOCUS19258 [Geodia barretti]|uniref:Uncharacterized protein n=1 Tax=Geodia barretti TaxID=519541 RepID=A0AA35SRV6_GEOBA|nr:hypothetical protein GBAR_LOCUS19258 [Geodia barretti]
MRREVERKVCCCWRTSGAGRRQKTWIEDQRPLVSEIFINTEIQIPPSAENP